MSKGYCIQCRDKVDIIEGVLYYAKNGHPMEHGRCAVCKSKVTRFMSHQEREYLKQLGKQEEER